MAEWKLRLFGEFRLSSSDGAEVTALGRRDRAAIAYLALAANQRETRERLAALIWSSRGDEQARHSLAQSTAVVRKALGDTGKTVIASESTSLAIDRTKFDIDVLSFRALVGEGTREALQAAAALYRDDLLPGFEIRSEGFDEWIAAERDRLRTMAVDALYRLTSLCAQAGDWDAVIETANRTLAIDNLREDAHRLLMRAYAQSGQRAPALQHYKNLAQVLDTELQVAPDAETEYLIADIRAGRISNGHDSSIEVKAADGASGAPASAALDPKPRRLREAIYWSAGGLFAVLLVVATVITATFWRVPELAPAPIGAYIREVKTTIQPHPLSIAILPFESHGDADASDFAEALSGGITTALSITSEMRVVSRVEMRQFENSLTTAQEIARKLNVRYFLEGNVNKWGDQIGIELGLIDTQLGQHRIWSEAYGREAGNFTKIQQDVTFDVITQLEIRLTEGEQERINRLSGTQNFDAWLSAARGEKHLRSLTPQGLAIARVSYLRALEFDPAYAGALEGLAWTYFVSARFGWTTSPHEAALAAKQLAEQALSLDPSRPQTYSLLGSLSLLAGDFTNAVALGEKAFAMNPNDADVAALLAYTLTYTGEPQRAISLIDRAANLRPVAPQWYDWLRGRAYRLTGRFGDASAILLEATRETPTSPIPLIELAAVYSEMGRIDLARHTASQIIRLSPQFTVRAWAAASPYKNEDALGNEVIALRAAGLPD